ncbi:Uncharacterised protein [Vibrio cholerae]|nr:Uncharacterised protein [Vibrio cholerae]
MPRMNGVRWSEIVVTDQIIYIFICEVGNKIERVAFFNFIVTSAVTTTLNFVVIFTQSRDWCWRRCSTAE